MSHLGEAAPGGGQDGPVGVQVATGGGMGCHDDTSVQVAPGEGQGGPVGVQVATGGGMGGPVGMQVATGGGMGCNKSKNNRPNIV